MATSSLGSYFDVQSPGGPQQDDSVQTPLSPISTPQRILPRPYHSVPQATHDHIELESTKPNVRNFTPYQSGTATPSEFRTPKTPNDLEQSRPASPNNGFHALHSWCNPSMNKYRMMSVCLMNFGNGMNDSAVGALLPYMESHYNIGYATVATIFITNAVGFILAAFFIDYLRARFGRSRTLMISSSLMLCGFIPIVCTPPFGVVVFSFFLLGLGMAINLSLGNIFAVNLQNGTTMLGMMHGSYGLGGTIAPLIATYMAADAGLLWSRFYLITTAVTIANGILAGWAYRSYEAELAPPQQLLTSLERLSSRASAVNSSRTSPQASTEHHEAEATSTSESPLAKIKEMLPAFKSRTVLLGALFIFAYQGAEVSISGWVISFLISARNGNPASIGYVTSGFWGGITLGRLLISPLAHKMGEKSFVYIAIVGATIFELIIWLTPNIIGDAVAVALSGVLLGPIFPCGATVFSRLMGRKEQLSGMSLISATGSSGGAAAPFVVGVLSQAVGSAWVLHPIAIGLYVVMVVCWTLLPKQRKRTD